MTKPNDFTRFFFKSCCATAIEQDGKRCPICRANLPYFTTGAELLEGDKVTTFPGAGVSPYATATVTKIERGLGQVLRVHLTRPYLQTSDAVTTGGLIPYLGWEQYSLGPTEAVLVLEETWIYDVLTDLPPEHERLLRYGKRPVRTKDGGWGWGKI